MKGSRVEYHFLKQSIERFSEDLRRIEKIVVDKFLSDDELLDIVHHLIVTKEIIESLERVYSKK